MTIEEVLAGDKSKLLKFEDRLQLTYDKGERYFEDQPVPGADIEDLDLEAVSEYTAKIGYGKSALDFLTENRGFVKDQGGTVAVSTAAILLFGKDPQKFFPRARIRFIRFDGTKEKFGAEMNVIKDVVFNGTILQMVRQAIEYLDTQIIAGTGKGR